MKQMYTKSFTAKGIHEFIEKARAKYYAEDNDFGALCKNMGKAIAYAETSWSFSNITEDDALKLIQEAENVINEVIC